MLKAAATKVKQAKEVNGKKNIAYFKTILKHHV